MRRRTKKERIFRPYRERIGNHVRFRIIRVTSGGSRSTIKTFSGSIEEEKKLEEQANRWVAAARLELPDAISMGMALLYYKNYMLNEGNKSKSVATTMGRLGQWFEEEVDLAGVTKAHVQKIYESRMKDVLTDTHRNELAEVKTFFRWCIKQGWISSSPAEQVEPRGKRRKGKRSRRSKQQLRGGEAQRFSDTATAIYLKKSRGYEAALGNLLALWLGLRSAEIRSLTLRDVDIVRVSKGDQVAEVCWLWVAEEDPDVEGSYDGKSDAARRHFMVPGELAVLLKMQEASAQKRGGVWLFPSKEAKSGHREATWLRRAAKRICKEAGLPKSTPHGLRGTWSTLAEDQGVAMEMVAKALGHDSHRTTEDHYLEPGVTDRATAVKAQQVLLAGKKKKKDG